MKRALKIISAAAGAVLCAALAVHAAAPEQETITLIHVNDIHGYVEATETGIGYAGIAAYIETAKTQKTNVFAIDAGDTFAGNPNAAFDQGQSIAEILGTVPFDVMVLGNNDFFLGKDRLLELTSQLNYPSLAGNVITAPGQRPWADTAILTTASGVRLGFVSATCGISGDIRFEDPVQRLKEQVAAVRPQADIVIGLLHLGYEDSSGNTSQLVAREVDGIDLIIDGHSHTVLEQGAVVNDILITQAGEYGSHIGEIELTVQDKTLVSAAARLIGTKEMAGMPVKADTDSAVKTLLARSEAYFAQEIGQTAAVLDASRQAVRTGESNLGNLAADAVRRANGTEIALCIAGGIGGEINPGPITKKDILSIGRVNSNFAVFEMSGADIMEALNDRCSELPEPSGNFVQVSGIAFTVDLGRAAGDRVCEVTVGGAALDPARIYTVSGNEGMAGDPGFRNTEVVRVNPDKFQEIIEEYIAENSPVSPAVEGRIRIRPAAE